ncbi:AAA family ATPase [Halosimplex rubrum]|uniref:AAA family ATPase n=1 Tax=Halosimplex rubrum TaxID=869889 RepID=A0A7D5T6M2_9EURY|nr:archaea-specific SMC-related protein [Halosimplex rubrum]QLH78429.1 AAA family ATPase [Halosimplex rubrum]
MSTPLSATDPVQLSIENIGGIDESSVSFSSGVTILAGRNATNRTSFLQALMAGLGSENVSIKGDADEAHVELTIGDETYKRTLTRTNGGGVYADGDAFLDNPELADLFVFLLESNEARRAVELEEGLRELIMRPVDTAAIEAGIEELQDQRNDVERQLENLDSMQRELPTLEQRRQDLKQEIEEKEAELEATKEAIEDADQDLSATRDQKDELDDALESFRETRGELEDTRYNLEMERESITALESELDDLESELDELSETPMAGVDEVADRLDELRSQRADIDDVTNSLQKVIQFNEEMLEGADSDVVAALRDMDDPTDRLVDEQVVCWTCGSTVESDIIEETLDRLRDLRSEKLQERREIQSKMDDLKTEKATFEEQQRQRTQLEDRIEQIQSELRTRRGRVEELETERDRLEAEIDELEAEVETLEDETQSDLLDLHREANQFEFELNQLQDDFGQVTSEIDRIDEELERRDNFKARREEISDEIADLRTRIDQVESEAVDQFNEHMETVLEILSYENLERIWIERRQETVSQGGRSVEQSVFELHVVRSTADGTTYEDTVDHLSESEREVTGLVFALAGYLTHDVYETCPFLLMDSIEAIDSDRIARLVEYVADYAEYVVVALLPEDAQALDEEYERVTEI